MIVHTAYRKIARFNLYIYNALKHYIYTHVHSIMYITYM